MSDLDRLRAAVERQDPPPPPPPPGTVRCYRCRVVTGRWHTIGHRHLCPECDLKEEAKP